MRGWGTGWIGTLAGLMLAFGAGAASAGPTLTSPSGGDEHVVVAEQRSDSTAGPVDLRFEDELRLPILFEAEQQISLTMPEAGPEGLDLRFRVHPLLTVYVSADLSDALPRLDAVDGEAYWAPGVEVHVTRALSVFVEDFQPTSGVTGGDEDAQDVERAPERSWDGHQVALGVRYRDGRFEARGEVIAYTLSVSKRADGLGGLVTLRWSF